MHEVTRIIVQDLQFYAYHGVTEEERKVGRRFRLDLEADVNEEAGKSDRISDTVDYGILAQTAVEAATDKKYQTLERAVEDIGHRLLTKSMRIVAVRVKLQKLSPPMPMAVASVGVEKTFTRR